MADTPRLQDILDTDAPFEMQLHEGFDFWVADADLDADGKESLERANESAIPTVKLDAAPSAFWCRIGERTYVRWVLPFDEDAATNALARLHAAGESHLGEDGRLLGCFRSSGLLIPVWEVDPGSEAADFEDAVAAMKTKIDAAAAVDRAAHGRRARRQGRADQPPGHPALRGRATMTTPPLSVAVVIPAKDESARIAATIRGVRTIPGVRRRRGRRRRVDRRDRRDRRPRGCRGRAAHARNHGKADAMMSGLGRVTGLRRVGRLDASTSVLFVDADLEASAQAVGALVGPVARGEADLTIATLPAQQGSAGGHGLVVGLARRGIEELTGWSPKQPLSGMRCLSPAAIAAATPFARGWGVEVGMTVDVLDAGLTILEVPCDLQHRVTGTDWRAQVHRAGQYRDVALALGVRRLRRRLGPG